MIGRVSAAETTLQELGVTEPSEIDVEVVARYLGAKVKYRPLKSCEARIVGHADRAIITVDTRATDRRKRFSVAHELGHWHHHRGQCLICRSTDIDKPTSDDRRERRSNPELQADAYAADLLLPGYIFRPLVSDLERITLTGIRELATLFDASVTATAIRALGTNRFPALLVCHGQDGRKWFRRPPVVPDRWFPRADLQPESAAFPLLFKNGVEPKQPKRVKASAWFDTYTADRFTLIEQPFGLPNSQVATLLVLDDIAMLSQ